MSDGLTAAGLRGFSYARPIRGRLPDSGLRFLRLRHQTKNSIAASAIKAPVNRAPSWLELPWQYVTIDYGGRQLGLLVETDDEDEARQEAQKLCAEFESQARIISVIKVVLQ